MGIKASATCVMNFDGAKGYLIGEHGRGLNLMFTFMNTARIGTAIQGWRTPSCPTRARSSTPGAPGHAQPHRSEEPRRSGGSDHRAPGRAPHAADAEGDRRGQPGLLYYLAQLGDIVDPR
jgi:hypothetical protein